VNIVKNRDKMFKKREKQSKEHVRELNRVRCQRYYQRHKRELKESKKFGSLYDYRKHKENLEKKLLESLKQEPKKQVFL